MLLAASIAGLGFAASPALAGSDGDPQPPIVQPPAPPPPPPAPLPPAATPAPLPPAPAPAPAPTTAVHGQSVSHAAPKPKKPAAESASSPAVPTVQVATRTVTVSTVPRGAVQAGGGGTSVAPGAPAAALGLGGASFALLIGAGGLAAVRRRSATSR